MLYTLLAILFFKKKWYILSKYIEIYLIHSTSTKYHYNVWSYNYIATECWRDIHAPWAWLWYSFMLLVGAVLAELLSAPMAWFTVMSPAITVESF